MKLPPARRRIALEGELRRGVLGLAVGVAAGLLVRLFTRPDPRDAARR